MALGFALAAFFVNLMLTGWPVGIFVSGLVLRNGLGAETFAWSIMFLFLPLTCVYYPVAVLPPRLQTVAWALPPTYVFEGMRALVIEHTFRADLMFRHLRSMASVYGGTCASWPCSPRRAATVRCCRLANNPSVRAQASPQNPAQGPSGLTT